MADSTASLATVWYRRQRTIALLAAQHLEQLWTDQADPLHLEDSWIPAVPVAVRMLTQAQFAAAAPAAQYVAATAQAAGVRSAPAAGFVPQALAGVASDGRDLAGLLATPARQVEYLQALGVPPADSMLIGRRSLVQMAVTQAQDAGRVGVGVASTANRAIEGYVRVLVPPSCSRCAILAGRVYRWSQGFQRHPKCDCTMHPVPVGATPKVTSPERYFHSLSAEEQNRIFTLAGAQAIRDGADPAQVVNARRGMATASIGGRQVRVTSEGSARRVRLMPEQIYEEAGGDRAEAIRLLRANGYLR